MIPTNPTRRAAWTVALTLTLALTLGCRSETPAPTDKPVATTAQPSGAGVGGDKGKGPTRDYSAEHAERADWVLDQILELETNRDVTCWTSFRQLDSFIATKQYSPFATLSKIAAVKGLVHALWLKASAATEGDTVSPEALASALGLKELPKQTGALPEGLSAFAERLGMKNFKDYRTTSEHWRVLLSLLQDELLDATGLKPLSPEAASRLTEYVTWLSLDLLLTSGQDAASARSPMIEVNHVRSALNQVGERWKLTLPDGDADPIAKLTDDQRAQLERLTVTLIDHKIKALSAYNKADDLKADIRRVLRGPISDETLDSIIKHTTETATFVARGYEAANRNGTNYLLDTKLPRARDYIDAAYVENTTTHLYPHVLLANADMRFRLVPDASASRQDKPLPPVEEILLEGYRMDAIRDSAVHWRILKRVWEKERFAMDPFAAEVLSEMLSVVLTLYTELATGDHKLKFADDIAMQRFVPPGDHESAQWSEAQLAEKARAIAPYAERPRFKDASAQLGLDVQLRELWHVSNFGSNIQRSMFGGSGVGDVNGDGWPDLFVAAAGFGRLLINQGPERPGAFKDTTEASGLPVDLDWIGSSLFFDRDGDGDLDLLLIRWYGSRVFDNQGDGAFKDVTDAIGLKTERGALNATIFDADNDGDLDIYIGYYGSKAFNDSGCSLNKDAEDTPERCRHDIHPPEYFPALDGRNGTANQLWLLQPNNTYALAPPSAGVDDVGWTLAVSAFDLEQDGDQDLYLANDFGRNTLFRNKGDGTFEDITQQTLTGDRGSGMNVSFTDINADGHWDIYVANIDMFSKKIKVVWPTDSSPMKLDSQILRAFQYMTGNKLYVYNPNHGDTPNATMFTSSELSWFEPGDRGWSWASIFFDVDHDGDEDMYLSNGWIPDSYAGKQANQLFVRDDRTFYLLPSDGPEAFQDLSRGVSTLDADNDGDLDLLVSNLTSKPVLLENVAPPAEHHWIQIDLRGTGKNTRAVGAQVAIKTPSGTQRRLVTGGVGYLGQDTYTKAFGLGTHAQADVTVHWPDGHTQTVKALPADKRHTIRYAR